MEFTVFYAWQSDSPSKENRYLIRDALRTAVESIEADASVDEAPRLDQDTAGVPGTPGIADTILEKISRCGVFVCDLTLVASVDESDPLKRSPNPNVLFELGYAVGQIGWERIIGILNEDRGSATELPFDLRHRRWPIRYRSNNKTELAKQLEYALRSIVKSGVLPAPPSVENSEWYAALMNTLLEIHIAANQYPDRVINPWAEELRHICDNATTELASFRVAINADQTFTSELSNLEKLCDDLVEVFRRSHLGSGPRQKEVASAVADASQDLFNNLIANASFTSASETAVRDRVSEIALSLNSIVDRLSRYEGRTDELQTEVSALAGEALTLAHYPVTSIPEEKRVAIIQELRLLNLINTRSIYCDGGVSAQSLFQTIRDHVAELVRLTN